MKRVNFSFFAVWTLVGCSASATSRVACSRVQALPVSGTQFETQLKSGAVEAGWGGILDLLEDPANADSSSRSRCTVFMDYVPVSAGQAANPKDLAFWTADHCLDFTKAKGAELNLFDPSSKKYVRLSVTIPDLEKYKSGLELFEARVAANVGDSEAESDLVKFRAAGARPAIPLNGVNGVPIIERGADVCKSETSTYKSNHPGKTVICSSVLDLARVKASVSVESALKPEVMNLLTRLSQAMTAIEAKKFESAALATQAMGTPSNYFTFFLNNWRVKVGDMTRWRRYESMSPLIEKVRVCGAGDSSGICAAEFKNYFKDATDEYLVWVGMNTAKTFPVALHDEVYAPKTESPPKFNLAWLLEAQAGIATQPNMLPMARYATNFSLKSVGFPLEQPIKTLGEVGPLYFGLSQPRQFLVDSITEPVSLVKNSNSAILVPYPVSDSNVMNFFMQPGDSGSVLTVANTPVGVIATVDGKETSGGASVRTLPEFTEETSSSSTQAGNGAPSKTSAQTGCR